MQGGNKNIIQGLHHIIIHLARVQDHHQETKENVHPLGCKIDPQEMVVLEIGVECNYTANAPHRPLLRKERNRLTDIKLHYQITEGAKGHQVQATITEEKGHHLKVTEENGHHHHQVMVTEEIGHHLQVTEGDKYCLTHIQEKNLNLLNIEEEALLHLG